MSLAEGTHLGRYEIRSLLGAGGMGEVYLAEDVRLRRKVALKILPENIAQDSDRLSRFEQEAFAASALNHPNILTIYEIAAEDSTHFIATEFIDGETLRERLNRGDLKLDETLDIAQQTAFALSAAHTSGIVHRDIKPENIMLRKDGIVKVLDFGLAKLTEKSKSSIDTEAATQAKVHTDPGTVMGTISHMSPEQARGGDIDARTDIWSLGVVLYEMISGQVPFAGETASHTIVSILEKEAAPLAKFSKNVPVELERIVRKTLRKERDERYQTARDLMIDLKTLRRELDLNYELTRSLAPTGDVSNAVSTSETVPTQILSKENLTQSAGNVASTKDAIHQTSSAEYIATGIKQHKRGFAIGLAILLISIVGLGYWFFSNRTSNAKQIESIAVLPFVNESGNPENEYLSDGMTETLISSLSQIPKLNVKARSSVFRYKGKETDLPKIAQELNVQAILNGKVVQRGQDLTLYIELVDTSTEKVLWSENYNRSMTNLVALQNEIARDVSNKLRIKLTDMDEQKIAKNHTTNSEAYQLYLKGRYHWNKRKPEEHKKAIEYYEQAIALDPNYALAYAGLADCYAVDSSPVKGQERMLKLRAAANKALEIDSRLGEPHAALANVYWEERDWEGAEREFKLAIELNPNYATAHQWYGELLTRLGRHEESIAKIKRARELDPLSLVINSDMIYILTMARRYDEAIAQGKKTLEMEPSWRAAHFQLAEVYAFKGMYEESLTEEEIEVDFSNRSAEKKAEAKQELASVREAYRKSGAKGYWQKRLEFEKQRLAKGEESSPFFMAVIYAFLGDKDEALKWLEKTVEQRGEDVSLIKVYPAFDPLRSDPRFQDLVKRVGLP